MAALARGRRAHHLLDQPRRDPRPASKAGRQRRVSLRGLPRDMPLRHPVGMSVTPTRFGAALFFTLALAPGFGRAAAAETIETRIERQGEYITVSASAVMQVDARIAWEVLSDYDNLAQFIPDMKSSRVVSRSGDRVVVEQKGEIGFFFYRQPVDVTLEVLEQPHRRKHPGSGDALRAGDFGCGGAVRLHRSLHPRLFPASVDRHADRAQDRRAPVPRHGRGDRAARRARARPAEGLKGPRTGSRLHSTPGRIPALRARRSPADQNL